MNEFPFSEQEWAEVCEASRKVTNATLADDHVLRESLMIELQRVLEHLRSRYGDHPVLLETAADFQECPTQRLELYRSALALAEENDLPTLSIRLSLARLLLEDFGEAIAAARELAACQHELSSDADPSDLAAWSELLRRCGPS